MGCCSSNLEYPIPDPESFISNEILKNLINTNIQIISKFNRSNPNDVLIISQNIRLNALGISILISNLNLMKNLHRTYSASFSVLEEQLQLQNIDLITIMIKHFSPEIIKYYIPIYLENHSKKLKDFEDLGLSTFKPFRKVHPVRFAAEHESLDFIKFIYSYYKGKTPPDCFDLHSIDEDTGENCALIGCRIGSLELVEYFYKIGCDFKITNKYNETAINLAVAPKKHCKKERKELVLFYLIEKVKLDISINFEETLILSNNPAVTKYIEEKLANKGIPAKKAEIEALYKKNEVEKSDSFPVDLDLNISDTLSLDISEGPMKIRKTISFLSSISNLSSVS